MRMKWKAIFLLLLTSLLALAACSSAPESVQYDEKDKENWYVVVRNKFGEEKVHSYRFSEIDDGEQPIEITLRESGEIHNLDVVVMYRDSISADYVALLRPRFYSEDPNAPVVQGQGMPDHSIPIQFQGKYFIEGSVTNIRKINATATSYSPVCKFKMFVYVS